MVKISYLIKDIDFNIFYIDPRKVFEDSIKSNENLYKNVKAVFKNSFLRKDGKDLAFNIEKIIWSKKMTRSGANFRWYSNKKLARMSFSYRFVEAGRQVDRSTSDYEILTSGFLLTVRHELVHYFQLLFGLNLGHDNNFRQILTLIGGNGKTYLDEELVRVLNLSNKK